MQKIANSCKIHELGGLKTELKFRPIKTKTLIHFITSRGKSNWQKSPEMMANKEAGLVSKLPHYQPKNFCHFFHLSQRENNYLTMKMK